jgi:hypothetical protein
MVILNMTLTKHKDHLRYIKHFVYIVKSNRMIECLVFKEYLI